MTKIDIISGFLGAGKTTFIKKMLEEAFAGEQVVLIENEFGEIGIDGGFLKDAGVEIREMNSGCICCSLVGDFGKSLQEVAATYHPDRILIEPSGVGKLSDVIRAVLDVQDMIDARLNSFITIVDAMKCRLYMNNFGEFFSNQVESAGAIILSRTDKARPEKIEESYTLVRELNQKAPVITTPIASLTGEKLLEIMEGGKSLEEELLADIVCSECRHKHEHHEHGHEHKHEHTHEHKHEHEHKHGHGESCGCGHHHAEDVFTSWGRETIKSYTEEEISGILQSLESDASYGTILRAKGMVAGDGNWIYFDMVPEEQEIRRGAAEYTGRVCVIGSELNEKKLAELFGIKNGAI